MCVCVCLHTKHMYVGAREQVNVKAPSWCWGVFLSSSLIYFLKQALLSIQGLPNSVNFDCQLTQPRAPWEGESPFSSAQIRLTSWLAQLAFLQFQGQHPRSNTAHSELGPHQSRTCTTGVPNGQCIEGIFPIGSFVFMRAGLCHVNIKLASTRP